MNLGKVVRASLSGAGVSGPQLATRATSLAFGERTVGSTSASQTTMLRNTGTTTATLTGITSDGDFAQTNDCPPSLGAGGSCTITVTFTQVEGAVSGSALATALYSVHSVNDPFDPTIPVELRQQAAIIDMLRLGAKHCANNIDADRPAVSGLRPDSPYYARARRQPAAGERSYLPAVDYYTFYGDIRLVLNTCYLGCHVSGGDAPIGDLIMMPGAPTPYGIQASGGARFSAPSGNSWEWGMRHDIAYYATHLVPVDLLADGNAVREAFGAPESHINFGNGQTGAPQVGVANCQTGHAQQADAQLRELLRARLAGQGYRCGRP